MSDHTGDGSGPGSPYALGGNGKLEEAARAAIEDGYTCTEKFELGSCDADFLAAAERARLARLAESTGLANAKPDPWISARGNIETASGHRYHFEDPDPDVVSLEDIAHALSNICRFGGHTRRFYSVAEHSVLVSRIIEARQRQAPGEIVKSFWPAVGLMHDGHEAYVWDAPSPLKPLLGDTFKDLADIADRVIWKKFFIQGAEDDFHAPVVKSADKTALVVEARALLTVGPNDDEWEPLPPGIQWAGGLDPREAKTLFLNRAKELGL